MPKIVKSEAKKRLLVTEGELRTRCVHRHEVVRRLVAVDLRHRGLHGRHQRQRLDRGAHRQHLARVHPLVLARVLPDVLPERDVDGGRLLVEEARDR